MKTFLIKLVRQGKLKLVEPSEEIKDSYVKKSDSNLISSKILFENGQFEEAVALTYFSMYNLTLALFFRAGVKCENHKAVSILLKEVFNIDNSGLLKAKEERIDKQYYTDFNIAEREVEKGIGSAENFNRDMKSFILSLNNSKIEEYRRKFGEVIGNE